MKQELRRIGRYFAHVSILGRIIGALGMTPSLLTLFGVNSQLPKWTETPILIAALIYAGYTAWRNETLDGIDVEVSEKHANLLNFMENPSNNSKLWIKKPLEVNVRLVLNLQNRDAQHQTSVRFFVHDVDSEWEWDNKEPTLISMSEGSGKEPKGTPVITLNPKDIKDHVSLTFPIKFTVPDAPNDFAYLGSLSKIIVILRLKQASSEIITLSIPLNTAKIRTESEEIITRNLKNLSVETAITETKRVWVQFSDARRHIIGPQN